MLQCPFLTTIEEEIDCFKECSLFKGVDSDGKCPFVEFKNTKPFNIKDSSDYDSFNAERTAQLRMLYKENYV